MGVGRETERYTERDRHSQADRERKREMGWGVGRGRREVRRFKIQMVYLI